MKKNLLLFGILFVSTTSAQGAGFVNDTVVLTLEGYVSLKDLRVEDVVISSDDHENIIGSVASITSNSHNEVQIITLRNKEELKAHPDHLFWVESERIWKKARDLKKGDALSQEDGFHITVKRNKNKVLSEPLFFTTLRIIPFPTFYVGNSNVLVHTSSPSYMQALLLRKEMQE